MFGNKLESEFTCLIASSNVFHAWLLLLFDDSAIINYTVVFILIFIIITLKILEIDRTKKELVKLLSSHLALYFLLFTLVFRYLK